MILCVKILICEKTSRKSAKKTYFCKKIGDMVLIKKHCITIISGIALLFFACCDKPLQKHSVTGEAQGTYYSIIYFDSQNRDLSAEIDSILSDFDQTASLWVGNSLIRRINDNSDSVLNELFCDMLDKSLRINRLTDGYFDCTVGKLVNAWGFGFKQGQDLDSATVDSLRQYTGLPMEVFSRDGSKILRKARPETELDFNAIAQGYSVDIVANYLESKGITNCIIDIGGEVIAKGGKPDGSQWTVGVERPAESQFAERQLDIKVTLANQSIVTSGNYRKFYEKDGVKYSHTIDPHTGYPVNHSLLSVSVIADSAWKADAFATAFMAMGMEKALQYIENNDEIKSAYFIYNENGEYKTFATEEFKKITVTQ